MPVVRKLASGFEILKVSGLVWIALLVSGLSSCHSEPKPPRRAPGVPLAAVWAGGVDGGSWILCTVEGDYDHCKIYDDFSGRLIVRGSFVLAGQARGVPAAELRYNSFDGESLHLLNGRALVPVPGKSTFTSE